MADLTQLDRIEAELGAARAEIARLTRGVAKVIRMLEQLGVQVPATTAPPPSSLPRVAQGKHRTMPARELPRAQPGGENPDAEPEPGVVSQGVVFYPRGGALRGRPCPDARGQPRLAPLRRGAWSP